MTHPLYFDGLLMGLVIILGARLMRLKASHPSLPVTGKILLALAILGVATGWRPVAHGMLVARLVAAASMVILLLYVLPALHLRNK